MFVCVCNAIRESGVRGAREAGCRSPEEVMSLLGAKLECRACVSDLVRTLDVREAAEDPVVVELKAS